MQLELFKDPDSSDSDPPKCPGEFIKFELKKRGWGQAALAEILGKPLAAVNEVIKGKRSLTPEMAVALGKAFGQPPELWAHREAAYRLSLVKDNLSNDETERKAQLFEKIPVREIQKRGWIDSKAQSADELEKEVDAFLANDVVAALRTGINVEFSNTQRAWLCKAAALSKRVSVRNYSRSKLEDSLPKLRQLASLPENAAKVPILLAELGVRFVIVEDLPRTKIDGAAFFLNEDASKPVVALSLRIDRMESAWHTLGHEIHHILNEDSFSLDSDLVGRDESIAVSSMEIAANEGAANWLIPSAQLESFILRTKPYFSRERIIQFANRIQIHPSIIVGQLHHKRVIGWEKSNELCPKVRHHFLSTTTSDGYAKLI